MDADTASMIAGAAIFAAGYGLRSLNARVDRKLTDQALKDTRADERRRLAEMLRDEAGYLTEAGGEAQQRAAATFRVLADWVAPDTGPVRRGT